MDTSKIVQYVVNKVDGKKEQLELVKAIEEAICQMEAARTYFESVNDPKLIDYAIYMEQAAKARYAFLISEAKRLNIKTQHENIFKEEDVV